MFDEPSQDELLMVGPRFAGSPKVKSAYALRLPVTRATTVSRQMVVFARMSSFTAVNAIVRFQIVFLFQDIILTSILVLFLGLLYHDMSLSSGAQTIRPGWLGPVSYRLSGLTLTGYFFELSTFCEFTCES